MAIRELTRPRGSVPVVFHVDSFVSERFRFVYHCVPKALSRSMLEYLATVDPDGYRIGERSAGAEVLQGASGADAPTSFTFVRNPYSRVVAVYYDKFVNYQATQPQLDLFARYERLRPDMAFSEFVDWLATGEGSDERADPHFLSQHYFLLDVHGEPAVDYLGKVESAEQDVVELQELLGLEREPLPHLNSNRTGKREEFDTSARWLEVLDDRAKRTLVSRYDGDFELLGYPRLPYRIAPFFARGATRGGTSTSASGTPKGSVVHRAGGMVNKLLAPLGVEMKRTRSTSRRTGAAR